MNISLMRNRKVAQSLEALGLNVEHLYAITIDNPSANAPYHNADHCSSVALNSLDGAKHYGMDFDEQRILFLAGLYHDFDHTVGKHDDDVNIQQAVNGLRYWCGRLEDFTPEYLDDIASIIEGTIWPPELFTGTRNFYQNIICDADHMTWVEPDIDVFIKGFAEESGRENSIELTAEFLKKTGTKTAWGKERLKAFGVEMVGIKNENAPF